jgi:hypothetical protein
MATLPQPPSFDAHLASLELLPLFMNALPEDPANGVALSVLQSLVHDGTVGVGASPMHRSGCAHTDHKEVAQNRTSKSRAMYFRGRQYSEAFGFYMQGVTAQATGRWAVKRGIVESRGV